MQSLRKDQRKEEEEKQRLKPTAETNDARQAEEKHTPAAGPS
jgi:hypothetical protein